IFFLAIFSLLTILSISGCGAKGNDRLSSKDEAEIKFIRICKDEYKWDVNTKLIGNTLWLYLPQEKDIFKFEANRFAKISRCTLGYLKGGFSDGKFFFEYQVLPLPKSEEDKGYTSNYTEQSSKFMRNIFDAIYRVYFNAEEPPKFYVIVMADITNGVEIIYTIYNEDLKRGYNNAIASEEFYKRILRDTIGNLAIVNDKAGRHLTYKEINFEQFLTEQIVQRIRIKFYGADAKICNTPEEEIFKIFAYCFMTYEFNDYSQVILEDLSSGYRAIKSRAELENIKEF
ncbi:MAG: hypothetical protein ABH914_01220, partial [Candidatus Omnitrophota bacterium]